MITWLIRNDTVRNYGKWKSPESYSEGKNESKQTEVIYMYTYINM